MHTRNQDISPTRESRPTATSSRSTRKVGAGSPTKTTESKTSITEAVVGPGKQTKSHVRSKSAFSSLSSENKPATPVASTSTAIATTSNDDVKVARVRVRSKSAFARIAPTITPVEPKPGRSVPITPLKRSHTSPRGTPAKRLFTSASPATSPVRTPSRRSKSHTPGSKTPKKTPAKTPKTPKNTPKTPKNNSDDELDYHMPLTPESFISNKRMEQKLKNEIAKRFKHISYRKIDEDSVLLMLKPDETLTLRGYCELSVLRGAVHCYGADLTPASRALPLYSERTTFYQSIRCIGASAACENEATKLTDYLVEHDLSDDDLSIAEGGCVLLLSRHCDHLVQVLRCCQGVSSLFRGEDITGFQLGSLPLQVLPESCDRVFNQSAEFISIDFTRFKKMIFCGGAGCGKSTMTKYVVNKLLSSVPRVAYLDFDLGQSELGPPGFMSLYIVDAPLIGIRMTHLRKAYLSHYYGNTNPSDVAKYITQVMSLSKAALELDMPLVVNTCGWIENMGLELQMNVIQYINPDAVFQLKKGDVTSKTLMDKHFFNEFLFKHRPVIKINADFVHWHEAAFKSKVHHEDIGGLHLSNVTKRSMSLSAYFSPCFSLSDHEKTFNDLMTSSRPYTVPWSAFVLSTDSNFDASHIMNVLNCHLVGLSIFKDFKSVVVGRIPPLIVSKYSVGRCQSLGLGFVRSINYMNRTLDIVTPLSQHDLYRVNLLQMGNYVTPTEMLMSAECRVPYNGYPVKSTASTANVSRRSKPKSPRPYSPKSQ